MQLKSIVTIYTYIYIYTSKKVTLDAPEEMKDELYCQLIKQTTNNASDESLLKGWELMSVMAGSFPPSKNLEPYLLSYIHESVDKTKGKIKAYAQFAMKRLTQTIEQGKRGFEPTTMEVQVYLYTTSSSW